MKPNHALDPRRAVIGWAKMEMIANRMQTGFGFECANPALRFGEAGATGTGCPGFLTEEGSCGVGNQSRVTFCRAYILWVVLFLIIYIVLSALGVELNLGNRR